MNEPNRSIGCSVHECKHHAGSENYCILSKINVVNHSSPAHTKEETDCGSFETKTQKI